MADLKTQQNEKDVLKFLNEVDNEQRKKDCFELLEMISRSTGEEPRMWGDSIVGFGTYHYKYSSGREGDWFLTGFSPRKQNLSIYIMPGFERYDEIMERLGKFKTGSSCLYVNKLTDIDSTLLEKLVATSVKDMKKIYGNK